MAGRLHAIAVNESFHLSARRKADGAWMAARVSPSAGSDSIRKDYGSTLIPGVRLRGTDGASELQWDRVDAR